MSTPRPPRDARDEALRTLWRQRPRRRFARWSIVLLLGLGMASFALGDFDVLGLLQGRSAQNLERFLEEATPRPVRGQAWDWGEVGAWAGGILEAKGWKAAGTTLAISIASIVLAGLGGLLLCVPAARSIARPEPFLPGGARPALAARLGWRAVTFLTRAILVFLRAIPEYVWAFLLLAVFGPTAWPAVLALALHNAGILGKLDAEALENLPEGPLRALRGLGASRRQLVAAAAWPAALPRLLLYFFYRWETCVREATVLGMLGIVSLGYYIMFDARPRQRYDEMILLILLGAAIVVVGDLVSAIARRVVRRAS